MAQYVCIDCGVTVVVKNLTGSPKRCAPCKRELTRLRSLRRKDRPCMIAGCEDPVRSKDWCYRHYMRWYRHGDPLADHRATVLKPCKVESCPKDANHAHGWCSEHYNRWLRCGDPERRYPAPSGWISPFGYRYICTKAAPHPLEQSQQRIFEHRAVLYAKIGPGEHACTWCGRLVTWNESWPESPDALVTDHLNFDRLDNRPENLVPSCQPCNYTRHE